MTLLKVDVKLLKLKTSQNVQWEDQLTVLTL